MPTDLKRLIGERLRAIRIARGLTQEDVAGLIDRSVETVSNLERGQVLPSLENLAALSRRLGVELTELLSEQRPAGNRRESEEQRLRHLAAQLSDRDFGILLALAESLQTAHDSPRKNRVRLRPRPKRD